MRVKRTLRSIAVALSLIAVSAGVVACGGNSDSSAATSTDANFTSEMTVHHQGAISMAKLAQKRAEHPELRQLANDIVEAQQAEISVMSRIGDDLHGMSMDEGTASRGHGMQSKTDISGLRDARPFDLAFIDMMIPHHEQAIQMARTELAQGRQAGLRKLARDIITAQTREIAKMKRWRATWSGA